MKIMLITDCLPPVMNGISVRTNHWIQEFRKLGHQVVVFGAKNTQCDFEMYGFQQVFNPEMSLSVGSLKLFREILWGKYDVIHITHLPHPILLSLVLPLARMRGTPVCCSYHVSIKNHIDLYAKNYLCREILKLISKTVNVIFLQPTLSLGIAPTQVTLSEYQKSGVNVAGGLFRAGVDRVLFNPNSATANEKKTNRGIWEKNTQCSKFVLYVGRISPDKNLDTLWSVAKKLPDVGFIIVGDGIKEKEYKKNNSHMRNIYFAGAIRVKNELAKVYASADIFYSPSKIETCGFTILEALASGKPFVAFKSGAIKEIHSELDDWLVDTSEDSEEESQLTASKLQQMLNSDLIKESEKALKYSSRFTWKACAKDTLELYSRVLGKGKFGIRQAKWLPMHVLGFIFFGLISLFLHPILWLMYYSEIKDHNSKHLH